MSELLDKIWETKVRNCLMFSYPQQITEQLIRWVDEENPLHYNRNHFLALEHLSDIDIRAAIAFQKQKELSGFLLKSRTKLSDEIISEFALQEEKQLIMAQLTNQSTLWKTNTEVTIKDCQTEDISNDLLAICLSMTEDSNQRRWIHHTMEEVLDVAKCNSNYHWLVAYFGEQAVGRCYAFEACGCVQMEDLWVSPEWRHRAIATTMMKYIRDQFKGVYFLHTEAKDDVKEMYRKLGFDVVGEVYEYSKIWRQQHE